MSWCSQLCCLCHPLSRVACCVVVYHPMSGVACHVVVYHNVWCSMSCCCYVIHAMGVASCVDIHRSSIPMV